MPVSDFYELPRGELTSDEIGVGRTLSTAALKLAKTARHVQAQAETKVPEPNKSMSAPSVEQRRNR